MWEIRWLINVNNLPYRILVYKNKNLKVLGKINHGETNILVPTFWGHSQFGLYIFIAINLVSIIFILESIWFLPLTY